MFWEIIVAIMVIIDIIFTIVSNSKIAKKIVEPTIIKANKLYKIETYESINGPRFRIIASNGQIIAHSEAYSSKRSMMRTVHILSKDHNFAIVEEEIEQ